MLFALVVLMATNYPAQAVAQEATAIAPPPITSTVLPEAQATTAPPPTPDSKAPPEELSEPVPDDEVAPEPELPTRQVCRYVEVTGQRFPVRTCRTVTIYPDETR